MCLNPRKILNPSLSWHTAMPKYLTISCGTCSECRARKQQEWFLRACAEFKRNRHGSNFFVTLTFRDEDLPYYTDARNYEFKTQTQQIVEDGHVHIVEYPVRIDKHVFHYLPVFDGDMITDFQKKFRVYLHRKYPQYNTSGVKFLICPEYGEHTKRQHYHCQIDCPFFLSVRDFKDICTRAWTHGWIGASKNKGFLIRSQAACNYTSKYVNKDQYYYNEALANYLDKEKLDTFEYEYRYNKIKRFLPRVRVSKGFGSLMADEILAKPNYLDFCCQERPVEKFSKSGKTIFYPIPKYILSKLTRKVDKLASFLTGNVIYTFTELGNELRKERFLRQIDMDVLRLRDFENAEYIKAKLNRGDSVERKVRSYLANTLPKLMRDLTPRNIAFYRKFLRYLPVDAYGKHTAFWYNRRFEMIIDDYFGSNALPIYIKPEKVLKCPFLPKDSIFRKYNKHLGVGVSLKDFNSKDINTLSSLGEFVRYEQAAHLLDVFYSLNSLQRSRVIDARNKRIEKVRSICVEFMEFESQATSKVVNV